MDYYCFHFELEKGKEEILLAFISDLPFNSFESDTGVLKAFLPAAERTDDLSIALEAIRQHLPFRYREEFLPAQNWNAVWESNFDPIRVGDFCGIRAEFHPSMEGVRYELIIQPRMAFGTGHHATTYMMIQLMAQLKFDQKKVLDYGCGTGILAILAAQQGALIIDAVDIEEAAFENTLINIQMNDTPNVRAIHGTLEAVVDGDYQIILANINKRVILETLPALFRKTSKGGWLLLSGILENDRKEVEKAAQKVGFIPDKQLQQGDWIALQFHKG